MGIDTHIPYTDGGYVDINNVISDLNYLGVHEVRDGVSNGDAGSAPLSSYIALAEAGVQFTFIVSGVSSTADLTEQLGLIDQVQAAVPGSVVAVEGANEINNWPVTFDGVGGLQGALDMQAALYNAVHADPALAGVAVDYLTGYGSPPVDVGPDPVAAGLADYDNQHPYPLSGEAPAAAISRTNALPNTTAVGEAAVYTETGYTTTPGSNGVSADVQAKYTLDLLFDAASQNISRTYLYQLLDAYVPGSPQGDDGYGLFDYTTAAKPAATAIHNLTTILGASGAGAGDLGQASYEITGLDSTGNSLVLAKPDGTYDVVIWAEPQIWDASSQQEVTAAAQSVTLTLSEAVAGYAVYDPLTGTDPIDAGGATSAIVVTVTDHPVIVELAPATADAAPTSTTSDPAGSSSAATPTADTLVGPDGQANYIRGGGGADSIVGGMGFNNINGKQGDDTIVGRSTVGDWLLGGQGADSINAAQSTGHNLINGNLGNDTLVGGSGGDSLRGGQGDDSIVGGPGDNWLSGDLGHNTLTGGAGADTFHAGAGDDVVTNFSASRGDHVVVDHSVTFQLSQAGPDLQIDLSSGGQMVLENTQLSTLPTGWILTL